LERKPGQSQDGHATLLKIIGDVVHFEGFIEKTVLQVGLELGQGGGDDIGRSKRNLAQVIVVVHLSVFFRLCEIGV
jgi:hypothetical protein